MVSLNTPTEQNQHMNIHLHASTHRCSKPTEKLLAAKRKHRLHDKKPHLQSQNLSPSKETRCQTTTGSKLKSKLLTIKRNSTKKLHDQKPRVENLSAHKQTHCQKTPNRQPHGHRQIRDRQKKHLVKSRSKTAQAEPFNRTALSEHS